MNMKRHLFLTLWFLLPWLTACQTAPKALQGEFASLSLTDLPTLQNGARVRWAGLLHQVRNERMQTCLIIVALAQKPSGKPRLASEPQGRFEACVNRFLDPAVYTRGRAITVTGTLEAIKEETVGEYPLQVPVVRMDQHLLWRPPAPQQQETILLFDPWWPSLWYHGPVLHRHHLHRSTPEAPPPSTPHKH